jgi:hypothetical protein
MVCLHEDNRVVRLKASVRLKETRFGGRQHPAASHYFPNIKVKGVEAYARFNLGPGRVLDLGVVTSVELAVVLRQSFLSLLFVGQTFSILEGQKEVGEGIIESI